MAIYLDFQKAFDTVNHAKHLQKLETIGMARSLLKWFPSERVLLGNHENGINLYTTGFQKVAVSDHHCLIFYKLHCFLAFEG